MQIGNNSQYEDWENGIKVEKSTLSDTMLEITFFTKSKAEFNSFLKNKEFLKKIVNKAKSQMGYNSVFCRLFFGKFILSENEQRQFIDLQSKIFDLTTIQLIEDNFDVFQRNVQYAKSKGLKISPVIDLDVGVALLTQIIPDLIKLNPANVRFIYHKPTKYARHYETIYSLLHNKGLPYYAVNCTRRCGLIYDNLNAKNISTSVMLKLAYGFNGCCQRYQPARKRKDGKIGFPSGTIWAFNSQTFEFEEIPNKNFRQHRFQDFINLQDLDLSQESIESKPKLKLLLANLRQ